jgi:hypothetical protein
VVEGRRGRHFIPGPAQGHADTDPTDDQFLEFLGVVKGSTGRNDLTDENFCDQMLSVIG